MVSLENNDVASERQKKSPPDSSQTTSLIEYHAAVAGDHSVFRLIHVAWHSIKTVRVHRARNMDYQPHCSAKSAA